MMATMGDPAVRITDPWEVCIHPTEKDGAVIIRWENGLPVWRLPDDYVEGKMGTHAHKHVRPQPFLNGEPGGHTAIFCNNPHCTIEEGS